MGYELFEFAYAPMVATAIWAAGMGLLGYFVVFRIRFFDVLVKQPLAPPVMSLPAVMFTFLLVFMASAAWQNITLARTSLVNEHAALARMVAVPIEPASADTRLRASLKRYLSAVIGEEWVRHYNQATSPEADAALDEVENEIWTLEKSCRGRSTAETCASSLAISSYLKALDDLRTAREKRLSLGFAISVRIKWFLVIFLGVITATAVAAVHRANPKGAVIALSLFCTASWLALSVVTLHYQPYRGPDAITPALLETVRARL